MASELHKLFPPWKQQFKNHTESLELETVLNFVSTEISSAEYRKSHPPVCHFVYVVLYLK